MKNTFFYETVIGKIGIAENGEAVTQVYFCREENLTDAAMKKTELLREAGKQLEEYLLGKRKTFELPFAPCGTEFQQRVWKLLREIPYGETWSYGEIARRMDHPKASRAVGMANNKNPIAIMIPCHRVIGVSGKLVGYAGGLEVKEYLLKLEQKHR